MEDDGTGGGTGGGGTDDGEEEPRVKRAKAKATGKEARAASLKLQGKTPKKTTTTVDIQKATETAMTGALDKLIPTLQTLAPPPSAARQGLEEAEQTSAKLAVSSDLRAIYQELVKTIAEQKNRPEIDTWYVDLLE